MTSKPVSIYLSTKGCTITEQFAGKHLSHQPSIYEGTSEKVKRSGEKVDPDARLKDYRGSH